MSISNLTNNFSIELDMEFSHLVNNCEPNWLHIKVTYFILEPNLKLFFSSSLTFKVMVRSEHDHSLWWSTFMYKVHSNKDFETFVICKFLVPYYYYHMNCKNQHHVHTCTCMENKKIKKINTLFVDFIMDSHPWAQAIVTWVFQSISSNSSITMWLQTTLNSPINVSGKLVWI